MGERVKGFLITVDSMSDLFSLREELLRVLDLCGTFAFAISGATAGMRRGLDVFGVLVLSFATSSFGGIGRDILIGATPPAALEDWRYLTVSIAAGLISFYWISLIEKFRYWVLWVDAAGLAFFAVSGTVKALTFGLNPLMAALLGMMTGVGGGMVRDVLLAEVPVVLRSDLYAVAALIGAGIVATGYFLDQSLIVSTIVGGVACFVIRVLAIRKGWQLPVARINKITFK